MSTAEIPAQFRFSWQKTTVAELAGFERSQGQKIVQVNGIHWREVRPYFFRPLLPFREYPPESVTAPPRARFGGCQFAVPSGSPSNSFLNLLLFRNANAYSLAALESKRRWEVRSAAKVFTIREITDVNEFKEKAFPIYLSFYQRTEYEFKKERLDQYWFSQWADALYQYKKFLILGAYRNGQLEAICNSQWVEDTVLYSTAFGNAESLRLNVNSLLLHSVRESVASHQQAAQVFAGFYKFTEARGIDDFYLLRGCSLVAMPAALRVHPLVLAFVRTFLPREHMKLAGTIPPHPEKKAGSTVKPAGAVKEGQSAPASAPGQSGA